jgi:hypothetical protein
MSQISALILEAAWEKCLRQSPLLRALTLLQMADPGASCEELAQLGVGERDRRLLALRERLIGARFDSAATCPSCAERSEVSFDCDALRRGAADAGPAEVQARHDGWTAVARIPNTADLLAIARSDAADQRMLLLRRCIRRLDRDGVEVASEFIPEELADAVQAALAEADPMGDLQIALTCPACALPYCVAFDISGYLWHEVDERTRKLLRDVHVLASSYGWSEGEILALSDVRRERYLELVAGQ